MASNAGIISPAHLDFVFPEGSVLEQFLIEKHRGSVLVDTLLLLHRLECVINRVAIRKFPIRSSTFDRTANEAKNGIGGSCSGRRRCGDVPMGVVRLCARRLDDGRHVVPRGQVQESAGHYVLLVTALPHMSDSICMTYVAGSVVAY